MYTVVEVFFSIWMDMRVQQLGFLIFFNFISLRCCLVHSRGFLELWWEEKPPLQNQMKRVKYSIMNHLLYMPSSKYLLSRRGRRILEPSAHHQREREGRRPGYVFLSYIIYPGSWEEEEQLIKQQLAASLTIQARQKKKKKRSAAVSEVKWTIYQNDVWVIRQCNSTIATEKKKNI